MKDNKFSNAIREQFDVGTTHFTLKSNYEILKRLYTAYISNQKKPIILVLICMIIVATATAISAWLMKPVLDDVFLKKDQTMLTIIPFIVVIITLIKGIATFYQTMIMQMIGQHVVMHIQSDLFTHIMRSDIEFFHHYQSGGITSRFINEADTLRRCVCNILTSSISDGMTIIGLIGVMFYQSISLSILALLVFPVTFKPIMSIGSKIKKLMHLMQEKMTELTIQLEESVQNINIVKSYCREEHEISRINKIMNNLFTLYKKYTLINPIPSAVMEAVGGIGIAAVIWYGGYSIIQNKTTPGTFFSFITALLMLYRPLKSISSFNNAFNTMITLSSRLFNILDEKPTIYDQETAKNIQLQKYDIEFRNISFSYPDKRKVIDSLSMKIHEHSSIALVGASGQGKTTIFNLIERFYDPQEGTILISGYDIRSIKIKTLRDNISLVSQETMLFDDNVMENIRYGRLTATDNDVIKAAKLASAHNFIMNLTDQYNTKIGQKGAKLSGGQKQQISIARAILKDAPILLLDEATSSLDNISENQIQSALENLKKGRTTIIIAHRLSTIKNADKIYLISKGKIIEEGTHTELLKANGQYKRFYSHYTGYKTKKYTTKFYDQS